MQSSEAQGWAECNFDPDKAGWVQQVILENPRFWTKNFMQQIARGFNRVSVEINWVKRTWIVHKVSEFKTGRFNLVERWTWEIRFGRHLKLSWWRQMPLLRPGIKALESVHQHRVYKITNLLCKLPLIIQCFKSCSVHLRDPFEFFLLPESINWAK